MTRSQTLALACQSQLHQTLGITPMRVFAPMLWLHALHAASHSSVAHVALCVLHPAPLLLLLQPLKMHHALLALPHAPSSVMMSAMALHHRVSIPVTMTMTTMLTCGLLPTRTLAITRPAPMAQTLLPATPSRSRFLTTARKNSMTGVTARVLPATGLARSLSLEAESSPVNSIIQSEIKQQQREHQPARTKQAATMWLLHEKKFQKRTTRVPLQNLLPTHTNTLLPPQTLSLCFEILSASSTTALRRRLPLSPRCVLNTTHYVNIPSIPAQHAPSVSCVALASICLPLPLLVTLHVTIADMSLAVAAQPPFAATAAKFGCRLTLLIPFGSPPGVSTVGPVPCLVLNRISGPPLHDQVPMKLMI